LINSDEEIGRDDAGDWVAVAVASGLTQANIISGRLQSEGIPTRLQYEAAGSIYAITIDGLGAVRILVPVAEGERAKELLCRSYGEDELPWEKGMGESAAESTDPEK
jgi:hypothetical protein